MASGSGETVTAAPNPRADPFVELPRVASVLVLIAVFFAILMGAMDGLVVATVLPTISVDLHQVNGVTFVAGAYLISSTISIPIFPPPPPTPPAPAPASLL